MRRAMLVSPLLVFLISLASLSLTAQAPAPATAKLREIHADGQKYLSELEIVALAGLQPGAQIAKADLQAAADRLLRTGLFASVTFHFQTHADGVIVSFHVAEAPRLPVYFDNLAWFGDSELNDAIRRKLPFYDGTLPVAGATVDIVMDALAELLKTRGIPASLEHQVVANPRGDGSVQQFRVQEIPLRIASIEFSDTALAASKVIQQHLSEIRGKEYSRTAIDVFLFEQVRPIYLAQGYLRVRLGPPEVRLTGNPSQKFPEVVPVFVPIEQGPVYRWKTIQWTGNSVLSAITLDGLLGAKPGSIANGMEMEAGWDRVREQYAHRGYLEAKIDPAPSYDDRAHTVAYQVSIHEGQPFKFGKIVITGLSLAGEKRLREVWPFSEGAVFDKATWEDLLATLQTHKEKIFGELPLHYDSVGHWLQTDTAKGTVDVLMDFK